jgi:hypothetical protein
MESKIDQIYTLVIRHLIRDQKDLPFELACKFGENLID